MAKHPPHPQRERRRKLAAPPSNHITKAVPLPSPPPSRRWKSTTTHHAQGFWDLLSSSGIGISLTKHALQEFDQRNTSETRQGPLEKPLFKNPLLDIKRFARHGGPGLSDIKGVSHPRCASLLIADYAIVPRT